MKMTHDRIREIFGICLLFLLPFGLFSQSISITNPMAGQEVLLGQIIGINAQPTGVQTISPAYIQINNTLTGYRKVKFGYSPTNIYSPSINVIAGGNTHVSITLRNFGGAVDRSRIKFRPMATGNLTLQSYVIAAGGVGDAWKTISIPLSDFDAGIDFTQIAYIEFPYSSDAGNFNIAFSEIKFTGGSIPFMWFGEGKTDNKHDGTGGTGSLLATLIPASLPSVYVQKVEFFVNGNKIGEDATLPYSTNYLPADTGNYSCHSVMRMSDLMVYASLPNSFRVIQNTGGGNPMQVVMTSPAPNTTPTAPAQVMLKAEVSGLPSAASDYLRVSNQNSGFRKLKFGYSATNIYNPPNNVISGGNTHLEITLKNLGGFIDWSSIRLKPMSTGNLSLLSYINAAGGVGADWKTISIPLADFDPSVDFTQIAYLEFPYSADAGNFEMAVKSVRFVGGSNPFNWFGDGKNNNSHNGNGGPGELVASIQIASNTGDFVQKVEFYRNDVKVNEDLGFPYQYNISGLTAGNYSFYAKAYSQSGLISQSEPVNVVVSQPAVVPSPMGVAFTSPTNNTLVYSPTDLQIKVAVNGEVIAGPNYLKVINNQTGYRKLKMGYDPTSIYGSYQNVIAGGNNSLQIELKDFGGNANWSSIRIRPAAVGSLSLQAYINTAVNLENGWKRISIPLSAFDAGINFSALQFFEFPYSAGAPNFEIGVRLMKFTGGSTPFVWFGEGKINNAHDGFNGAGQLLATVINGSQSVVSAQKVELYNGSIKVGEDNQAPFEFVFVNAAAGNHKFVARLTDSNGAMAISDTLFVSVQQNLPPNSMVLTVTFATPPTYANVSKAPLRYNKDFAYSLTLDDSYRCAYTYAYSLLKGGLGVGTGLTYPGLYYTDGCGNDISFAAASAWNTANASGNDMHISSTNYINWPELQLMLNAGWNVLNHSYQHESGTGTNYTYQVQQNTNAIFSKTGVKTTQFVIPSGDANYIPVAFANGMYGVYANNSSFLGWPNGLLINNAIPATNFSLFKRQLYSEIYNPSNITQHIDNVAALATNGNKYWYNDFTHRVQPIPTTGSLAYSTFEYYMNYVASTYGKNGSDRVWMAPLQDVYEYLRVRDLTTYTVSLYGNTLRIVINRDMLPADFTKYALSFVLQSDASIVSVACNHPAVISYRGNTAEKLINITWDDNAFKSSSEVVEEEQLEGPLIMTEQLSVYPNPANDYLTIEMPATTHPVLIQLLDFLGNVALEQKEHNTEILPFSLNISGLKEGIYFLRIIQEEKNIIRIRKVLIIR